MTLATKTTNLAILIMSPFTGGEFAFVDAKIVIEKPDIPCRT